MVPWVSGAKKAFVPEGWNGLALPDGDQGEGDTAGGHEGDECVTGAFEGLGGKDAKVKKEHGFLVQEDGGLVGDLRAEEPLARRY